MKLKRMMLERMVKALKMVFKTPAWKAELVRERLDAVADAEWTELRRSCVGKGVGDVQGLVLGFIKLKVPEASEEWLRSP